MALDKGANKIVLTDALPGVYTLSAELVDDSGNMNTEDFSIEVLEIAVSEVEEAEA